MRSSFSMPLLYHAYVYLEFLILACTIYILASYNNLKLGYIRLKDASDKDKCTYVPAWCLSKQDKGYDRYPVYVNAIDGTIIRSDDLI